MAIRAFDVAALGDMVVVWIPLEIFRPLSNSLERFMAFETCLPGGGLFWLCLPMACLAGEAPLLMAVRGKVTLFLDRG